MMKQDRNPHHPSEAGPGELASHEYSYFQINDIHRLIAREIAKDEQSFNNAARQNEEFIRKEKEVKQDF